MSKEGQPTTPHGEQIQPNLPDEIYAGIAVGFLIQPSNKEVVKELQLEPLDFDLAETVLDLMGDWEKPHDKTTELLRFEAFSHFNHLLSQHETYNGKWKGEKAPLKDLASYLQRAHSNTKSWNPFLEKLERDSGYIPEELRGRKNH